MLLRTGVTVALDGQIHNTWVLRHRNFDIGLYSLVGKAYGS